MILLARYGEGKRIYTATSPSAFVYTFTKSICARMSLARPRAGQESPRESRSYRATLKIHRTLQHKDRLPTQLLPRRWPAPHIHTRRIIDNFLSAYQRSFLSPYRAFTYSFYVFCSTFHGLSNGTGFGR